MANYPDFPQLVGSAFAGDDGTVLERAVSGKPRLRTFYTNVEYNGQIVHELDGPDKDAIWAHYLAHRTQAFTINFRGDGLDYNVRYVGPPDRVPVPGTDRWRVVTKLVVA